MRKPISEETREKMRAARRGKPRPDMFTDNPGPRTVHTWLQKWHPRKGACEQCGKTGKTEYAFQRHPEPYTRDRNDYKEMCRSCHLRLDGRPMTPEVRAKIAEAQRGKRQSAETIEKRIAPLRGRKRPPYSAEWRANMSAAKKGSVPWNKGMKMSDEYRAKLSEAHRRKPSL